MAFPPIAMCTPLVRLGDPQHLLLCTKIGQLFGGRPGFLGSYQPILINDDVGHLLCAPRTEAGARRFVSQPLGPVSSAQRLGIVRRIGQHVESVKIFHLDVMAWYGRTREDFQTALSLNQNCKPSQIALYSHRAAWPSPSNDQRKIHSRKLQLSPPVQ